ncbi:MAG: response regulator [Thiohalomonadales bacterium]
MKNKYNSLNAKATLGLIFIGVISIISITAIFKTIVHSEITLIEQDVIEKEGDSIVAGITQYLSSIERLVQNMAQLAKELPKDKKIFHDLFPKLLGNNDTNSHVAGGGIWPEPYEFDKAIERMSFFWGREKDGSLKFYNNYNDPKGNGYQNEEWYVPAKYINEGDIYWSRSYMDPFSYEAMVTATVPYLNKQNNFSGVATVDIKLSGLNSLFKKHVKYNKGYIFAVDRNDVFLSFPENNEIKPYKLINNKRVGEYFTLKYFVKKYNAFSIYENHIKNERIKYSHKLLNADSINNLSSKIDKASYQIEKSEAIRIATDIKIHPLTFNDNNSTILYVSHDPVLKTDAIASIHYLPKYHWFVAVVTPRSIMMTRVDNTIKNIFIWILLSVLIIFIMVYLIFNKIIMSPLKIIRKVLEKNIKADNSKPLPVTSNDEIGQLATLFNQYSSMIEKSRLEADNANNAKSEFLSRMSHELRTPLNAIIGFSQLLEMEDDFNKDQKENIHEIYTAGNHLLLLVNDLIDISRIENDVEFLDIKPNKLETIIQESINMVKPIQKKYHISIDANLENCHDLCVIVDNTAAKQVFINVMTNAIKYSNENGNIIINCRKNDSYAQIDITDNGIGIEHDKLESIFEPFNRLGKEFSDIEGTGIGLYVTKKLLEDMQGTITVTSEPNKGSTFTVKLPISVILAQNINEPDTNTSSIIENPEKINILIVEDIQSNQKIIQRQIQSFGFSSEVAANGEQALVLLNKNKYDLVLTDCTMPVMDGYQLTKLIRAHKNHSIATIPIIALTANAMLEIEQRCLDAGMSSYLSKPIDIMQLKQQIEHYLIQANE